MKKFITILTLATMGLNLFATDETPDLLKNKENFSKPELFKSITVFADKDTNIEVLKNYEMSPASYKNNELLPVAICYMSLRDFPKAKKALESFLSVEPDNMSAIKAMETVAIITKDLQTAKKYSKIAIEKGDKKSILTLSKLYLMENKVDALSPYVTDLKEMAKTNLDALNILMVYAGKDSKAFDESLAKEILNAAQPRAVLQSATPESMSTVLRIFSATNKLWPKPLIVVPARSAALAQLWSVAFKAYQEVLDENPNDLLALRGMGLVNFRIGDLAGARDTILKAYKLGEKDAVIDGIELFLLSNRIEIWNAFKEFAPNANIDAQVLAGLIQYSVKNDNCADIFYLAALNKNNELLYKDAQVLELITEGAKKYESDSRSSDVKKLVSLNAPTTK